MSPFGNYTKIVTLVVGAAIAWVTLVLQSPADAIQGYEWLEAAILGATALGVYGATNAPSDA